MRFFTRIALIAFCAIAASAAAADYKSEYKAYDSAIAEGDLDGALAHGEAAWRQAEAALGETTTTAVLAYNYAVLAATADPAKALEAFDRAIAIAQKSGNEGAIPLAEAQLRRAEARLRSDFENKTFARELETFLSTFNSSGDDAIEAQASGWRTLAAAEIGFKKFDRAKAAADNGTAIAARLNPPMPRLQREILFLAGLSRIAGDIRKEEDIIEAIVLFDRAAQLFPPQKDIDHFDPLLAQIIGWRQSVGALANSYGSTPRIKTGTRLPDGEDLKSAYELAISRSALEDLYKWETPVPPVCNTNDIWSERKLPPYPKSAARSRIIGAILVGYEVDGVGVVRTVVLTDFSEAGFGDAAVASMKKWRLKPDLDPACWKNNITIFTFILN